MLSEPVAFCCQMAKHRSGAADSDPKSADADGKTGRFLVAVEDSNEASTERVPLAASDSGAIIPPKMVRPKRNRGFSTAPVARTLWSEPRLIATLRKVGTCSISAGKDRCCD